MTEEKKKNIRWNTMQLLVLGFLGVIFFGAVLLWLPICNNEPIAFTDALFTSTAAVCVTGLFTITPAVQFTLIGKVILLLLIQVGGLGVIACATAFFLLLKKKITVREKVVIQEAYNMDTPGGMVGMMRGVFFGTILVELVGAVLFSFQFVPEFGVSKGIWFSIFHSVSTFCNAGIDILGSNSLMNYVGNPFMNITTLLIFIASGLGFIVWHDIFTNGKRIVKKEMPVRRWFTWLSLHSKLALVSTGVLLVLGAVLMFLMEHGNPATMGGLSHGEQIMASFFQSATTRTAGFTTIPQSGLHTESKLICGILMIIGGSPGGTASGVKTTTVAMVFLTCITYFKGGKDTECFGRRIAVDNIRTGFIVAMVALSVFGIGTILLTVFEPDTVAFIDILFEAASALGTAGLTTGITSNLGMASQIVIMIMMYLGRLGPLTLALVIGGKVHPRDKIRQLPERKIMVL